MAFLASRAKLLLPAILLFCVSAIFAAQGDLDRSFAGNGFLIADGGTFESVRQLVVQTDGKIVAMAVSSGSAEASIRRFNTDGGVDSTFGSGGKVSFSRQGADDIHLSRLALQPDGKIVFVGSIGIWLQSSDFYIGRLNTDGSFDTTFNGTGTVRLDLLGTFEHAYYVQIQPDDKVVVAGDALNGNSYDFAVVRLNTNGSLDSTFNGDGTVFTRVASEQSLSKLILQSDGKIVLVGSAVLPDSTRTIVLIRYISNGSLDSTFDGDGVAFPPPGTGSGSASAALQSNGKIIVMGGYAVLRFNVDGSLDSTFGTGGRSVVPPPPQTNAATDVAVQADDRIVLSLTNTDSGHSLAAVMRLDQNGSLDVSFHGYGWNSIIFPNFSDARAYAVTVQTDGKILLGGDVRPQGIFKLLIARFQASSCTGNCYRPAYDKVADFDGDAKTDASVFRNGTWFINPSRANDSTSYFGVQWGLSTDIPTPADFDGDDKTDVAVWRGNVSGSLGYFYILQSSNNTVRIEQFGQSGDDPRMVGDWDGDAVADLAVFRPGVESAFIYRPSSQPSVDSARQPWGTMGDEPVRGDFDGDRRMDPAIYRPSDYSWWVLQSTNGQILTKRNWGWPSDKRVAGDFDGDGKTDFTVYRDGIWYILQSSNGQPRYAYWGLGSDQVVAGDYDGDGITDFAVWRNGVYYILPNSGSPAIYRYFGLPGDIPIASAYIK